MDCVPIIERQPETKRYNEIKEEFVKAYNKQPTFFARAPGRVNLIGEHIDYCGYAVLPMAIEQDIVMAVSTNNDNRLHLANSNSEYVTVEVDISNYEIDKLNPKWQHYVLCGYRGVTENGVSGIIQEPGHQTTITDPAGLDIVVNGTIPRSAGLSSSSALVCCAALSTAYAFGAGHHINKVKLADVCQHCEHYIGTEGGGMDQSISFLAFRGTAKLIEFNPIRATDIDLPRTAVFVISNCCVEMNKAATDHFNVRVAECRLATQVLAKLNGLTSGSDGNIKRLGDVQSKLGISLSEAVDLVEKTFHAEPYSKAEICQLLELTVDELNQQWLSERSRNVEEFKLRDRAQHVYSEADRVLRFKTVCEEMFTVCGSGDEPIPDPRESLGRLMYESHQSCRDLYQCSCSELDQLVELAMSSGALGSRLTGAGWGGCAVSLVPVEVLEEFMTKMKTYYTATRLAGRNVDDCLFATSPGDGAAIFNAA